MWDVRCDCGKELAVRAARLVSGNTTSCGCYHKDIVAEIGKRQVGERSGRWKGDDASYQAIHARIVRRKGKAKEHFCADGCGRRGYDWAYKHPTGYSTDPDDYVPRCRKCHMAQDERAKRRAA